MPLPSQTCYPVSRVPRLRQPRPPPLRSPRPRRPNPARSGAACWRVLVNDQRDREGEAVSDSRDRGAAGGGVGSEGVLVGVWGGSQADPATIRRLAGCSLKLAGRMELGRLPDAMNQPRRIFISYSHNDECYRLELAKHLSLLERQGLIEPWHDRRIKPGQEWKKQIDQNLKQADLILCLVSADFISSNYCFDVEMAQALKMHKDGTAQVVPIIVRPSDWHAAPFGKLQALPRDGKAITTWNNQDEAWLDVARGIRLIVEQGRTASPIPKTTRRTLENQPSKSRGRALPKQGFCVRCRIPLPFNPDKPFCDRHFQSWVRFGDENYSEKYCHQCGDNHADTICMRKPRCYDCWSASANP